MFYATYQQLIVPIKSILNSPGKCNVKVVARGCQICRWCDEIVGKCDEIVDLPLLHGKCSLFSPFTVILDGLQHEMTHEL